MATPVWPRQLVSISLSETPEFKTNVRMAATGVERRTKGLGPSDDIDSNRRTLRGALNARGDASESDILKAFFEARQGSLERFFMPSYVIDTTVKTLASQPTTTIEVNSTVPFTDVLDAYGNWVLLWRTDTEVGEVRRINTIGSGVLNLASATSIDFPVGSYVEIVILGRFLQNSWGRRTGQLEFWDSDPFEILELLGEYGAVTL